MGKLLRAFRAEQRKLWSKGSLLGCFVAVFVLSFAFSFMCSVVKDAGAAGAAILVSDHAENVFSHPDLTNWRKTAETELEDCEKGIEDTAVELTDAEGAERIILERKMSQYVRDKAVIQYRLGNDLAIRDWSGSYSLILCLWMITPLAACIACVYASDMFAGEFSRGTLRVIVSRPATRIKIYTAKMISALLLGLLFMGAAYAAAGIGCGVLMEPADGTYVGYINGSIYTSGWGMHVFTVFLCCCASMAVSVALCAALGNITRSRGVSAAVPAVLSVVGMSAGRLLGLLDMGYAGLLLPFCYDLTIPLCGVAYSNDCSFLSCALSMAVHFVALVYAGYAGFRRDI